MILLNKPLTREHLNIFKKLTIDAKLDMLDARPGWSYRGPIQNGRIYVDFHTWEKSKYRAIQDGYGMKYRNSNYGFKRRKKSEFDKELDFLNDEDLAVLYNWAYCLEYQDARTKGYKPRRDIIVRRNARLDSPSHALFISDNSEWLLEASKKNLEDAGYEVEDLSATIDQNGKTIIMKVEDYSFVGVGTTMCIAALDLYGKTHTAQYDIKRPSFSLFSSADNVNITDRVLGEETIEISSDGRVERVMNDNDFHRYCSFISERNKAHISDKLGKEWLYWGKYHLAEGDYHIIQKESVYMNGDNPLFV